MPASRVIPAKESITHISEPRVGFFTRDNYIWMLAGVVVIIIGMLVMSGGKSSSPGVFDQKEVYSTTRITIAPLLIMIGLGIEVFAIFKKIKL